jgi:hypothetical protein
LIMIVCLQHLLYLLRDFLPVFPFSQWRCLVLLTGSWSLQHVSWNW